MSNLLANSRDSARLSAKKARARNAVLRLLSQDFIVKSIQPIAGGSITITWAAIPGRSYQVQYSDLPGGTLQNLGSPLTAGPVQTQLTYTNSSISAVTNRIYQVKLLPPP